MTRRSSRSPRRSDAVRNRAIVLAKTVEALRKRGTRVSVEDIARRAGVGAGTVIRSFGSKAKLIDAAIVELLSPLVERFHAATAQEDVAGALWSMMLDLAVFQHENRVLGGILVEREMPRTFALRRELVANATRLIERAQSAGIVRSDIDVADVTMLLSGIGHVAEEAQASVEQLRRYVAILMDGLRPVRAAKRPSGPRAATIGRTS